MTTYADNVFEFCPVNANGNPTLLGTSVGSNILPNGWSRNSKLGTTVTVSNFYFLNGIQCVDINISGTATAAGTSMLQFSDPSGTNPITAAVGQTWTSSMYFAITGTSTLSAVNFNTVQYNSAMAGQTPIVGPDLTTYSSTLTKVLTTQTLSFGSTAYMTPSITYSFNSGVAVNCTFTIGFPASYQYDPIDTVNSGRVTIGAIVEAGSGVDSPTSHAIFRPAVAESGSASDTGNASQLKGASVVESGSAVDVSNIAGNTFKGRTDEECYAADFVLAAYIPAPQILPGDPLDMLYRLLGNEPRRWFPAANQASTPAQAVPALAGLLSGPAQALSLIYGQSEYVSDQTRIATATEFNLDIIAYDFFGTALSRRAGETDSAFSTRIRANILKDSATRQSESNAVLALTGTAPIIVEPRNTSDTGGYGKYFSNPANQKYYGMAYGVAGAYGSMNYPYQMFVTASNQYGGVNPAANCNGYNGYLGGYGVGAIQYLNGNVLQGSVSNAEIYNAVAVNLPAGTIGWLRLTH